MTRSQARRLVVVALLIVSSVGVTPPARSQATFVVNSTSDPGISACDLAECTLREAIVAANGSAGADTITFNISGAGVHTITPASSLPGMTDPGTIDGSTQPGYSGEPLIEIAGSGLGGNGLEVTGSTVRALVINGFTGFGIQLGGPGSDVLEDSYIGTDPTGMIAQGNSSGGIQLAEASNSTIENNVISGNNSIAINMAAGGGGCASVKNDVFIGNKVGVGVDGTTPLGTTGTGISLGGDGGHTVGGPSASDANIIANNAGNGIQLASGCTNVGNEIQGNSIYANGGLGIDINNNGVTANDPGDGDVGTNQVQNFPDLRQARHFLW